MEQNSHIDLLNDAKAQLSDFSENTLLKLKTLLEKLPEKYKKEKSLVAYQSAKDSIYDFIFVNYPKTDDTFINGIVQYSVQSFLFMNLICEVPAIHKKFEEFYNLYIQETFQQIEP